MAENTLEAGSVGKKGTISLRGAVFIGIGLMVGVGIFAGDQRLAAGPLLDPGYHDPGDPPVRLVHLAHLAANLCNPGGDDHPGLGG
jgi:hypothetical protein